MKSPLAEAKVFRYVEHFHRLVQRAVRRVIVNDEVDVDVGVDKVAINRSPDSPLK